eukprot:9104211-Heterocapsa_arctica.AAC.1
MARASGAGPASQRGAGRGRRAARPIDRQDSCMVEGAAERAIGAGPARLQCHRPKSEPRAKCHGSARRPKNTYIHTYMHT